MAEVLLLNSTNEVLNICSLKRALTLLLKGKAEEVVNNKSKECCPSVIKLRYFVAVPKKNLPFSRKNIFHRDNYTCQYCGCKIKKLTLDHVFPKSRGGKNSWENLVTACPECNSYKANRTPDEAKMELLSQPHKPLNITGFEASKYSSDLFDLWSQFIPA
jgi:5-methylcytosine-specific restriction endonuclease McrA